MKNLRFKSSIFLLAASAFVSLPLSMAFAQVAVPPLVTKNFAPDPINASGSSVLEITIQNGNASAATALALTDNLPTVPANLIASSVASNSCGGSLTLPNAGTQVVLTGGSIAANSSCVIRVNVTAATPGTYINTIPAGAPTADTGGAIYTIGGAPVPSVAPAVDSLVVLANNPLVTKSFTPSTILPNGISLMTITIQNNNGTTATTPGSVQLTDALPAGVTVDGGTPTSSCGGAVVAVPGSGSVSFSGGTIGAGGTCTITLNVTSATLGTVTNVAVGSFILLGTETRIFGTGTADLTVAVNPPVVSKRFSPSRVDDCGCSTLIITLTNPANIASVLNFPFTDNLPQGLEAVGRPSTTCTNGVVSLFHNQLTLQSGSIPANGSCTVSVEVASHCNGEYLNRIPSGALRTNTGNNAAPAFARVEFCCEDHDVAREMCLVADTIDEEEGMSSDIE